MKVRILPSAQADLSEGFAFYEKQQPGLGAYSLDSLFAVIDSLALYGGVHRRVYGFHRMLGRTFPFSIYHEANDDVAEVWAVLDCRRAPKCTRCSPGSLRG